MPTTDSEDEGSEELDREPGAKEPSPSESDGSPVSGSEQRIPPPPAYEPDEQTDSLAASESTAFGNGVDLDQKSKINDHNRTEELRDLLKDAAKGIFRVIVVVTEFAIIFWAWHLLMPVEFAFLSDKQLEKIEHILQTVMLSGLVAGYARKVMRVESKA
jgi:hypothetical protein